MIAHCLWDCAFVFVSASPPYQCVYLYTCVCLIMKSNAWANSFNEKLFHSFESGLTVTEMISKNSALRDIIWQHLGEYTSIQWSQYKINIAHIYSMFTLQYTQHNSVVWHHTLELIHWLAWEYTYRFDFPILFTIYKFSWWDSLSVLLWVLITLLSSKHGQNVTM
jgi:hypothetical protein